MLIVPAIDIRNGQVVTARGGKRDRYTPIESQLCAGSDPPVVVAGLLRIYPFETIYIADLDAIEGRKNQLKLIKDVADRYRGVEFWVDAGINSRKSLAQWRSVASVRPVVGSESQQHSVQGFLQYCGPGSVVLSLDFRHDRLLGPTQLLSNPQIWAKYIIVMTLDRVGMSIGPDIELLKTIRRKAPKKSWIFAAGGVRSLDDLANLDEDGINGALLATALHDGAIGTNDIAKLSSQS